MHQLTLLAQFAPKQRAVTRAEYAEEKVRREAAFVEVSRDTPAGDAFGGVDLADQVGPADAALRRLLMPGDVDQRAAGETAEPTLGRSEDFLGGHAAAEREHDVGRHIAAGVIGAEVVGRDAHEEIAMADDRLPERMRTHRFFQDRLGQDLVVLVVAHRDLSQDDLALHLGVGVGDQRVEDHVGDGFHRGLEAFLRGVDVIDRPVEGRVGVRGTAAAMDGVGELAVREPARALEDHVLEVMRDARPFPAAFMDATRADPRLDGA